MRFSLAGVFGSLGVGVGAREKFIQYHCTDDALMADALAEKCLACTVRTFVLGFLLHSGE